jgi:hypothetical protein
MYFSLSLLTISPLLLSQAFNHMLITLNCVILLFFITTIKNTILASTYINYCTTNYIRLTTKAGFVLGISRTVLLVTSPGIVTNTSKNSKVLLDNNISISSRPTSSHTNFNLRRRKRASTSASFFVRLMPSRLRDST